MGGVFRRQTPPKCPWAKTSTAGSLTHRCGKFCFARSESSDCFKWRTCFVFFKNQNAETGVNNPQIPQRLKTERRFESICEEIRVWLFFFFAHFVCLFCKRPRGASSLMRLIYAIGTLKAPQSRELFDRKCIQRLVVLRRLFFFFF